MDAALPQKFPFILDRNLAKANCTENRVCTSCDTVVLGYNLFLCAFPSFHTLHQPQQSPARLSKLSLISEKRACGWWGSPRRPIPSRALSRWRVLTAPPSKSVRPLSSSRRHPLSRRDSISSSLLTVTCGVPSPSCTSALRRAPAKALCELKYFLNIFKLKYFVRAKK